MKKNLIEILKRLKNTGTIVSVASGLIIIYTNLGGQINNEVAMTIVNTICAIGVSLGVLNNPTTKGLDLPKKTIKTSEDPVEVH